MNVSNQSWIKNRGKWDRLQGKDLRTELGHAAVVTLHQFQQDRKLREAHIIVRNREDEKIKLMKERERNVSEELQNIQKYRDREPPINMSRDMTRGPPIPTPIWREPSLRFQSYGMPPEQTRMIHQDGPQFPRPRPTQIEDDNESGNGHDSHHKSGSQDNN